MKDPTITLMAIATVIIMIYVGVLQYKYNNEVINIPPPTSAKYTIDTAVTFKYSSFNEYIFNKDSTTLTHRYTTPRHLKGYDGKYYIFDTIWIYTYKIRL